MTQTLLRNWLEISNKARELSPIEFRDDMAELKHEVDNLRVDVKSLRLELTASKKVVEVLTKEVGELRAKKQPINSILGLFNTFVDIASAIDIVQKILIVETKDFSTVWTIIKASPFEDSLRVPVYQAQLSVLSLAKGRVPIDFYVLNLSELSDSHELNSIIPSGARIIWERNP